MNLKALTIATVGLMGISNAASASAPPAGPKPGWYLMPGGTLAATLVLERDGNLGFSGGGELSIVCYGCFNNKPALAHGRADYWLGAYAEVLHQPNRSQLRASMGPEFGWSLLGVDGGLVIADDESTHFGATLRGLVTFGVVTFSNRLVYLPKHDDEPAALLGEAGLTFKLPVRL